MVGSRRSAREAFGGVRLPTTALAITGRAIPSESLCSAALSVAAQSLSNVAGPRDQPV